MAFQTMNLLLVPPEDGRGSQALAPAAALGLKTQKEPLLSRSGSEEGLRPLRGDPPAWGRHTLPVQLRPVGPGDGMGRCGGPWASQLQNSSWGPFLTPGAARTLQLVLGL